MMYEDKLLEGIVKHRLHVCIHPSKTLTNIQQTLEQKIRENYRLVTFFRLNNFVTA